MDTEVEPVVHRRTTRVGDHARAAVGALGPGLISGAADDDPSGIATYAQAGAQFGYALGWTMLFSLPLIAGIQEICARIGYGTKAGFAENIRRHHSPRVLRTAVLLLFVANTINLGADLGAMGSAAQLLGGGPPHPYVVAFAGGSVLLQIFADYRRYVGFLKWTTLALFAYVATVLVVDVPWRDALRQLVIPSPIATLDYATTVIAVFGTTISPYLFFWQSSQEAEDARLRCGPIDGASGHGLHLRRIRFDTYVGMFFSNLIGFFITTTTAATLNVGGITDIQTAEQAALALRPLAGDFAFALFAFGIIGTGLLAVPVLGGSAAYAVSEAFGWRTGLSRKPHEARAFYAILTAASLVGLGIHFSSIDPMKALFWSAIINGFVTVPLAALVMRLASNPAVVGDLMLPRWLQFLGWATFAVMAALAGVSVIMWI
jgi:Mn2+/Fe2+ NRAMP family transporter